MSEKVELPALKGKIEDYKIPVTVIIGLVILIILFLLSLASLTIKNTYKLHYSEQSNLDYKVFLKDNEFFEKGYLEKDKQYVSSLIDYIDADFNYDFTAAESIGLSYDYTITADVFVKSENGKNLYEKKEVVVDKKETKNIVDSKFQIKENVKVDYEKYNKIASSFINKYDVEGTPVLVVSLNVDLSGKHSDYDKYITDKSVVSYTIPLMDKTTDISIDYLLTNSKDEVLQYKSTTIKNPILFYLSIAFAVIDFIGIALVVRWIINDRSPHVKYKKKLEKIVREYGDFITETTITRRAEDMIATRTLKVELVKTFEGLVDASDKLNKPILYHEERTNEETIFYIYDDKVSYIYIMKVSDFK